MDGTQRFCQWLQTQPFWDLGIVSNDNKTVLILRMDLENLIVQNFAFFTV